MTIKTNLKDSLKTAMKSRDQVRVETIRGLLSAMQYEEIQKGLEDLPDEATTSILRTEIKKRREEQEFAEKASRQEMLESLAKQIEVIESFLPSQLTAQALEKILTDLKTTNPALNMGGAMKLLKDTYSGQYDGKVASEIAKRILG